MTSNNDNVMIQIVVYYYSYRRDQITMIDSSLDKSQIDQIDVYSLCSSRSIIYTYTYTYNNGRRIKESIRS